MQTIFTNIYENGRKIALQREVTLQDLLNMTSGTVYPGEDSFSDPAGAEMKALFDKEIALAVEGKGRSTVDFCNMMGAVPLAFQPGSSWRYGTGADIMGAIIEVASGKSFRLFLKDELFDPLGMTDTDFFVPEEKRKGLVAMMQYSEDTPHLIPYTGNNLVILDSKSVPAFCSGGAGLFSTIDDYGKFANMLLNEGKCDGKRILGKSTIQFMRSNQLTQQQREAANWPQLQGYGYGNFMRTLTSTAQAVSNGSIGEYGWDGWAGVYFAIDPQKEMAFAYFVSRINYDDFSFRRRVRSIIYSLQND